MKDLYKQHRRRIEIAGMVMANGGTLDKFDYSAIFNISSNTLKVDLKELRAMGIPIHSIGKKGIKIENDFSYDLLRELISDYMAITATDSSFDKATAFLVSSRGMQALSVVVSIQRAIEENRSISIKYFKPEDNITDERTIDPLRIFLSEKQWRLLARQGEIIKQFLLERILEASDTEKKFTPIDENLIEEIFRTSLKSWLGNDKYTVRLRLTGFWKEKMKYFQLNETQVYTENADGSAEIRLEVNSLHEITTWIAGRGKGIEVIEPVRLKNSVISIAGEVLKNYPATGK